MSGSPVGAWPRCRLACADAVEQRPLPEQRAVGGEQRPRRVVDVRRFAGHAVQLDDGEIAARLEAVDVGVAHVEPADEEAGNCRAMASTARSSSGVIRCAPSRNIVPWQ